MKLLASLLFTLTTVLLNCMTKDGVCTDEFRMITVQTYNAAGPVILDSAFTIRNSTNQKVPVQGPQAPNGYYTVIDDSFQPIIAQSRELFTFRGFKSGAQVVNEQYEISPDKCHISKVSGKDSILVQ